jgi:serine/threonine protein kinase
LIALDIVHRDLKLENILIKEFDSENTNYFIKITDFGLSGQRATAGTESMFEEYCGTPLYMGNFLLDFLKSKLPYQCLILIVLKAPEIIDNYPYSQLCDVWALGIIMFFLYVHRNFYSKFFVLKSNITFIIKVNGTYAIYC